MRGIALPMVLRIAAQQDAQVLKLPVINISTGVNQAQRQGRNYV